MRGYLDRYSRLDSPCHRLSTELKLGATLLVLLISLCLSADLWPAQLALSGVILSALAVTRIPLEYTFHRVLRFLPFVMMFCLSIWLGSRQDSRNALILNLLLRSTVCFMAALWLVNTTPFDSLLAAMRRWGMPKLIVTLLAFMYRYLFIVFDELQRMQQARRARTFGRISTFRQWTLGGQLVGMLLVRGITRAERVHGAMCSRGWDGTIRRLSETQFTENTDQSNGAIPHG